MKTAQPILKISLRRYRQLKEREKQLRYILENAKITFPDERSPFDVGQFLFPCVGGPVVPHAGLPFPLVRTGQGDFVKDYQPERSDEKNVRDRYQY